MQSCLKLLFISMIGPQSFFFQCLNPSSTSCGNGDYGFIRSLDSHLFFFFFRLSGIRIWWVAISRSFGCLNLYCIWYIFYCLLTLGLFSWVTLLVQAYHIYYLSCISYRTLSWISLHPFEMSVWKLCKASSHFVEVFSIFSPFHCCF